MSEYSQYHLVDLMRERIQKYQNKIALRYSAKEAEDISWRELGQKVEQLALALVGAGLEVQGKVAIFSRNMPEWTIADLAVLWCRGVTVPVYPTNTAGQTAYILRDAGVRLIFVGEQEQMDAVVELQQHYPNLEYVIALDSSVNLRGMKNACYLETFQKAPVSMEQRKELDQRLANNNLDDLLTLIYTSGTTGEPKGVMLDYRNFASAIKLHDARLTLTSDDVSLCFLPLSHIFERAWTYYALYRGATNVYMRDPAAVQTVLATVRPTVMCSVPRLFEKVHAAILAKVATAKPAQRAIFNWSLKVGETALARKQKGKPNGMILDLSLRIADKLVFSKLRNGLGGRMRFMPCGGARLEPDINLFFKSIGLNVIVGYGLSETTATVSCYDADQLNFGTVGTPLPYVHMRIGEENEIQVKADTVMKGYYNKPEATAEAFTEDGWFRTGDAGYIDDHGNVVMTERLKDLMKTSGGKYIAPQMVEGTLVRDHFVEQVAIVGDARKYVSALIVPAFSALEEYAHSVGVKFENRMELLRHSHIQEMFQQRLEALQKELARFEQVKKFTLLDREFSLEMGELTPTLKLRRKVIMERFSKEIEAMYPGRN
ncbi:AMP-dependent synthetase/ligase [Parendozoicomonas haliclonae]|nr:long-chain fatty acid--CoA ligase [Parendozoicomonas haliclonae]